MIAWKELSERVKDPSNQNEQLMWQMLAVITTHPNYGHLTPWEVFEKCRQQTAFIMRYDDPSNR